MLAIPPPSQPLQFPLLLVTVEFSTVAVWLTLLRKIPPPPLPPVMVLFVTTTPSSFSVTGLGTVPLSTRIPPPAAPSAPCWTVRSFRTKSVPAFC